MMFRECINIVVYSIVPYCGDSSQINKKFGTMMMEHLGIRIPIQVSEYERRDICLFTFLLFACSSMSHL